MEKPGKPLISVLIPVYQTEEYLARCVDSVLAQTYPNVEIVLVDDGSTDNSPKVAARYAKRPDVRFYQEKHHGVSYVRQRLIERAKGEYFFFLDSDDTIDPQTLEILYGLMAEHQADMVQCNMKKVWQNPEKAVDYCDGRIETYPKGVVVEKFCCWAAGLLRCMLAAKLYKREVFQGIHFPEGKIHEDEFTMHRILANCGSVVCTGLPLYRYFYNPGSITKRAFSYARYDRLAAAEDRYALCRELGLSFAADMVCYYYLLQAVEMYRLTYTELGESDTHLPWLKEQCQKAIAFLLATSYFTKEQRELMTKWLDDLTAGELPNFGRVAAEISKRREECL